MGFAEYDYGFSLSLRDLEEYAQTWHSAAYGHWLIARKWSVKALILGFIEVDR